MAGETGTKTPRCGQVSSGDDDVTTIVITMIITIMTDGNQMMMTIVMITETGNNRRILVNHYYNIQYKNTWMMVVGRMLPDGSSITLLHIDLRPPWKTA